MHFCHADAIWRDYPQLVPGTIFVHNITKDVSVASTAARFTALAKSRLATNAESELPEVQAWRRVFSTMGLKPTQYRCASESLLRRFRREGSLPQLHPLVDLCNSMSLAFAIPIAVFDASRIDEFVEVRYASGHETFSTLAGETETPPAGEVIFVDAANRAHARRWTHRQAGYSAVRDDTNAVLIVAEGMHGSANADVPRLIAEMNRSLEELWSTSPGTAILTRSSPRFEFQP